MKIARYILLTVLAGLLLWGVLWARNKAGDTLCTAVKVVVLNNENTGFVTPDGVLEELANQHINIKGKPMWQINSDSIERILSQSPYLESADCVKSDNGLFLIKVRQLVPVMRVFDGDKSYYVNSAGKRMDALPRYYCNVPIVNGHFSSKYGPENLLPMLNYVKQDSVLNSMVTMYDFKDSDNIYIVPCFKGHVVNMGSVDGFENKFRKLLLFYKKVMPEKGWETYDTISVKWNYQVVATRRVTKVEQVIEASPEDDEVAPDAETMTVTDENKPTVGAKKEKNVKQEEKDKPKGKSDTSKEKKNKEQ